MGTQKLVHKPYLFFLDILENPYDMTRYAYVLIGMLCIDTYTILYTYLLS